MPSGGNVVAHPASQTHVHASAHTTAPWTHTNPISGAGEADGHGVPPSNGEAEGVAVAGGARSDGDGVGV